MAFIGDTTPISLQLKLTNYAESFESCYHVWRISFVVTILDEVDDVGNLFEKLSEENQQVLNWQASPENLQNDVEVRDTLTQQSGRLCPYKNISTSLYDKVKSDEGTRQRKTGAHPLSAYEQISFRSAMLTKHSSGDGQADGQPELLAQHDGLGGEQSFLRWRSHDYIKVTLCKPRPCFRVFWLIQWDIVGKLLVTGSPDDAAINQGKRQRSPLQQQHSMKRPADPVKFNGVRRRERRKSPWIAEMRPEGTRNKLCLGSYNTKEAAARAADAGYYYYNKANKLNFRDSPQFLKQIPALLIAKGKEDFVKTEARRLASISENLPSTREFKNRSCNTSTEEFTGLQPWNNNGSGSIFAANSYMRPVTNANFDVGLSNLDSVPGLMTMSESDGGNNLDFQPSTSCEISTSIGSSPEENVWTSAPTGSFTANSHGGEGVLFSPLDKGDIYQLAISPAGNRSPESDDSMLNLCDVIIWGDKPVALNSPGDFEAYDSNHGAESVQPERSGDWEGLDDIFGHWSMVQDKSVDVQSDCG